MNELETIILEWYYAWAKGALNDEQQANFMLRLFEVMKLKHPDEMARTFREAMLSSSVLGE